MVRRIFLYNPNVVFFNDAVQGRVLRCGGGVSGLAEKGRAPRGTERERALEAQFSDGIRDAAFACRVVES